MRDTPATSRRSRALDGSVCPACGKIRYYTRHGAKTDAARVRGRGGPKLRPYECGGFWHLTSQPAAALTWYRERGRT